MNDRRREQVVEDIVREPGFEAANRAARQKAIELLHRDRSRDPRLPWPSADRAIGPLVPGDVWVAGGVTGSFKTGFITNIESHFLDAGVRWACFGLELDSAVLTQFLAGLRRGLARDRVREGLLTDAERSALEAEIESLIQRTGHMHFAPEQRLTALELVTRVRVLVAEMGLQAVFVDHLHHLDFSDARDLRRGVTDAMHLIKDCATETGVSFVVASQLARDAKRDRLYLWRTPALSELRESGAIEQLADVALFVHRQIDPDRLDAARAFAKGEGGRPEDFQIPGRLGLTVAKHRFGKPIGVTVPLTIQLPTDRIAEGAVDTWEQVNPEDRPLKAAKPGETSEEAERRAMAEGA